MSSNLCLVEDLVVWPVRWSHAEQVWGCASTVSDRKQLRNDDETNSPVRAAGFPLSAAWWGLLQGG
eukprot:2895726-Amphidinium_carterae.2